MGRIGGDVSYVLIKQIEKSIISAGSTIVYVVLVRTTGSHKVVSWVILYAVLELVVEKPLHTYSD